MDLINEDQIPANLQPIDREPILPGAPAPPSPSKMPPLFSGSISPQLQHDGSFLGTEQGSPRIPKNSLMPLGLQATPLTNAAVQSTTKIIQNSTTNISSGAPTTDTESIFVNRQTGTAYTFTTGDNDHLVTFGNNAGGTLTLPGQTTSGGATLGPDGGGVHASGTTTALTTPSLMTGQNDLAIMIGSEAISPSSLGAGWATFDGIGANFIAAQVVPSGNSISGSATLGGTTYWASTLNLFTFSGSVVPTFLQSQTIVSGSLPGTGSAAMPHNVNKGNQIWVVIVGLTTSGALPTIAISDSQSNSYGIANTSFNPTPDPANSNVHWYIIFYTAIASATGALTVTSVAPAGSGSGTIRAYEMATVQTPVVQSGNVLPNGWFAFVENTGTGTFTIQSVANIDGASQTITLKQNQGILIVSDGTQYWTTRGLGSGGSSAPGTDTYVLGTQDFANLPNSVANPDAYYGPVAQPAVAGSLDDEFAGTVFNLSRWTWDNQSHAVAVCGNSRLQITYTASSSGIQVAYQTAPGTPWEVTLGLIALNGTGGTVGLALRDGTGKISQFVIIPTSNTTFQALIGHWTNSTTFSSNPSATNIVSPEVMRFIKVKDDGTNLIYSASYDGVTFWPVFSESRTSFFGSGPTQVGMAFGTPAPTGAGFSMDFFRRNL